MTSEEAWNFIKGMHRRFHSRLKHYGYGYQSFIPKHPAMSEMCDQEKLTPEQFTEYRKIFIDQIYNKEDLRQMDSVLAEKAVPALQEIVKVLRPFATKWGVKFPHTVEILTTYGGGGSYNDTPSRIIYRVTNWKDGTPQDSKILWTTEVLQHEFIHLLIEQSIIDKYSVPQDLKEQIIDIIGVEYFGIPMQDKQFGATPCRAHALQYITREAIENDLPGAVQRMMADWSKKKQDELALHLMKKNQNG